MPGGEEQGGTAVEADGGPEADGSVWRYAHAERASVIVDAEHYFLHMQEAMLAAKKRVFLIGWDFDTRIHLTHGRSWWQRPFRRTHPSRLGSFIGWLGGTHGCPNRQMPDVFWFPSE